MRDLNKTVRNCLTRLNIDPTHIGYDQLTDCVIVRITQKLSAVCKIYEEVGKIYDVKSKSIMRNITYALSQVTDLADRLSKLMGMPVTSLHNGKVIFYIADLVSEPSIFDVNVQ